MGIVLNRPGIALRPTLSPLPFLSLQFQAAIPPAARIERQTPDSADATKGPQS